jgi:Flp pilus assembly pilin Flp
MKPTKIITFLRGTGPRADRVVPGERAVNRVRAALAARLNQDRGLAGVEYALLLGLLSLVIASGLSSAGTSLAGVYRGVTSGLSSSTSASATPTASPSASPSATPTPTATPTNFLTPPVYDGNGNCLMCCGDGDGPGGGPSGY